MNSTNFVTDNWYWMAAAAASGSALLWLQLKDGVGMSGGVSPALAVQLINKERAQVIDVSEPAEFAASHVANAKNVPLSELASGKGLPGNKKAQLIVVCATGVRAAKAVTQLKALGYENAQSLGGGLKAWREANLPIDKA